MSRRPLFCCFIAAAAWIISVGAVAATSVQAVSGANQIVEGGKPFPQPFAVRVLGSDGSPVPGAVISFSGYADSDSVDGLFAQATCRGSFDGSGIAEATTDANGVATAPAFTAGLVPAHSRVTALYVDEQAGFVVSQPFDYQIVTPASGPVGYTDIWWGGPAENGWGMSIHQSGDAFFAVLYVYDQTGAPVWLVMPNVWSWDGTRLEAPLYTPRSAPYFQYDASQFDPVGQGGGGISITFVGANVARIEFSGGLGLLNEKAIGFRGELVRQDFAAAAPSASRGVTGLWWGGPSQNGWGVSIFEKAGAVFSVWYTYDANGKPLWFVMPGGNWTDGLTYAGDLYRTTGSPVTVDAYNPLALRLSSPGSNVLRFGGGSTATMTSSIDGHAATQSLTRESPF
jgi:hypothetical protein